MFKKVGTKLAHNTVVPSFGGNKDLRTLQDLITAEKTVLSSSQKFALDLAKSAEALKHWGMGEGDDLGDITAAATNLMLHFAGALNHFSNIEGSIREQMKAVRTREENLDEMKRRRRTLGSRAEDAERKLSKMNPENKNLQSQTAILAQLRDEIRILDTEIMNEETGIGDFKRQSLKAWLGNKFGGIQDFSEKGLIVSDLGKQLLAVIPLEPTQPGLPRAYYMGHARTEIITAEAQRAVQDVVFSPESGTGRRAGGIPTATFDHPQSTPIAPQPQIGASFTGYNNITAGDRPGETLMRADSIGHASTFQSSQAGSVPQTPASYSPPSGLPPGQQGYQSMTMTGQGFGGHQLPNYPTRSSFIGLPQIPSQQTGGTDLGMTAYMSPSQQQSPLPPLPEQPSLHEYAQQQALAQQQQGFNQPQLPFQQTQSPYQPPQSPVQHLQQQTPYPEPQQYPPQQPGQQQQHPMPQSPYANYTYPQAPGAQPQALGEVNEFGSYSTPSGTYAARSSSLAHTRQGAEGAPSPSDSSSARFATFPVKTTGPRPQPGPGSPTTSTGTHGSMMGAPPMEVRAPSLEVEQPEDSFSSSVAQALGQQWQPNANQNRMSYAPQQYGAPGQVPGQILGQFPGQIPGQIPGQAPGPQPGLEYQQQYHAPEQSQAATTGHAPHDSIASVPPGPPTYDDAVSSATPEREPVSGSSQDTGLAYMSGPENGHPAESKGTQEDKRTSAIQQDEHNDSDQLAGDHVPQDHAVTDQQTHDSPSAPSAGPVVTPHRAPTPSEQGHGDEASLNAAAAREVSRELDSLMFQSQQPPPAAQGTQPPQPPQPSQSPQPVQEVQSHTPPEAAPQPSYQPSYQQPTYDMYRARSPPVSTTPTSAHREPQYVREKDRSSGGNPSRQPTPGSPTDAQGQNPLIPPAAPTAGSLYGLGPSATGSATSFIPGQAAPRTISAAAFKRQVRQPTTPITGPGESDGGMADTSPLHVKKRLPTSPYPAGDGQRVPSAPVSSTNLQEGGGDSQYRPMSAAHAPQQHQGYGTPGDYYGQRPTSQYQGDPNHEEESYDYLSAYMTNDSGHGEEGSLR